MRRADTDPVEAAVELQGRRCTFARSGSEWLCLGEAFGGVTIDEITLDGGPDFPPWAAASLAALAGALPGALDDARAAVEAAAPHLLPEAAGQALQLELIGAKLLDGVRLELHFLLAAEGAPYLDTYGLWVASLAGGLVTEVQRRQM